jgi:hypothetical protein
MIALLYFALVVGASRRKLRGTAVEVCGIFGGAAPEKAGCCPPEALVGNAVVVDCGREVPPMVILGGHLRWGSLVGWCLYIGWLRGTAMKLELGRRVPPKVVEGAPPVCPF